MRYISSIIGKLLCLCSIFAVSSLVHQPVLAAPHSDERCFDATGFCIEGTIRDYWESQGGLAVFGYPLSALHRAEIDGTIYQVQLFERNRLELHPENEPPYHVLLGRLGAEQIAAAEATGTWLPPATESPQAGCYYAKATNWNVCGDILRRFGEHGLDVDGTPGVSVQDSVALFGEPITPLIDIIINGQTFQVQWFERARFELHPENEPPYDVQLGLLGAEYASEQQPTLQPYGTNTSNPSPTPNPLTATDYFEQGLHWYEQGNYAAAIEAYTRAIERDPSDMHFVYNRAYAYHNMGEYDRAIADYSRIITMGQGDTSDAYNSRGVAYHDKGDYARAIEDYSEAIRLNPNDGDMYYNRASSYRECGEYEHALADYTRAIALLPNDASAYNNRGVVHRLVGDYQSALADYTQAIALDSSYAYAYNNRGFVRYISGDTDGALDDLNRAIALAPNYGLAYNNRGLVYAQRGNNDAAIDDYTHAIALLTEPNARAFVYVDRGNIFFEQGNYTAAIDDYTQAIAHDASYALAYSNRGYAYAMRGDQRDMRAAIADGTQAIERAPTEAAYYESRGFIYEAYGNSALAIDDYRHALTLTTNSAMRKRIEERLTALGG